MRNKYVEILVALSIAATCILSGLYIVGVIKLPILDNIILKIVLTILGCIGFVLYIFLLFMREANRLHIIAFSILFDALGYWWLSSWLGYAFIVIGVVLLILSFFQR